VDGKGKIVVFWLVAAPASKNLTLLIKEIQQSLRADERRQAELRAARPIAS
jgi:hypothetical protein